MLDVVPGSLSRFSVIVAIAHCACTVRSLMARGRVDFAEGGIPWTAQDARRAGTVRVGGSFDEIAVNERLVVDGKMPAAPLQLVGQQIWRTQVGRGKCSSDLAYAHAPRLHRRRNRGNCRQIERFAPASRPCRWHGVRSTTEMSKYNENYVGGDIQRPVRHYRPSFDHV